MIPWKDYRLDEITKYITDGKHGDCQDCVNSGFYFLSAKDVRDGQVNYNEAREITKEDFEATNKRTKFEQDDILLTNVGASVGRLAIANFDKEKIHNTTFQKSVSLIKSKADIVIPKFIYYSLISKRSEIINLGGGSAQANLLLKDIRAFQIKLPQLPFQRKIASILSAYDELIENNKQRIRLLEEMAEEIYKEWFVRMRFPGHETAKFVDNLPEGWEIVKLRKCFEHYIGGGWGADSPDGKNEIPAYVIRGTDIPNARTGNLNFEVLRYHSLSNLSSRKLQANDIIFEVSGGTESQSLGRSLLISQSIIDRFDQNLICASFCKLIRMNQDLISALIIYLLFNRLYETGEIMLYQVQSTGISNYKFEDFIDNQKVKIPPKDVQQKFELIIQPMFDEIQILGQKNQLLQQTRDLLLPRLISGKLSVEHLVETDSLTD